MTPKPELAVVAPPAKKTKLKAVDPKTAEPTKPKVLVFGKPGVGKTWTSLDFPSVYYIDTEGGASRDHYTEKLKKSGGMYFGPEQGSQSFDSIIEQVQALATEKHHFKTLVIDSISKPFNLEITREAERLGDKNAFGADKKPAVLYTKRLISWIDRLDMNVILIAHEKALWEKGEQIGATYDGWDKLEYELDLALNIVKAADKRMARIRKSRLLAFPDNQSFQWSYEEFAERYGRSVMEKEAKHVELATPEQLKEYKELLEIVKLPEGQEAKWLSAAQAESLHEMDKDKMTAVINYIKERAPK